MKRLLAWLMVATLAMTGCHRRGHDLRSQPPPVVKATIVSIDRCSVRVEPAPASEREAFLAYAHRQLGDLTATTLTPTRTGDRIARVVLADAPSPRRAPSLPVDAALIAHKALVRYRNLFGPLRDDLDRVALRATRDGVEEWNVDGTVGAAAVHLELKPGGALRMIDIADTAQPVPAGALCDQPAVPLADRRIPAAVIGQQVSFTDASGQPVSATFTAEDVGAIGTEVIETERDVFRRVITVSLRGGAWTALVDADGATLLAIRRN